MIFLDVLLPVFLIFAIGYIGQKTLGFDTKTLSKMALYLLSPVLVFRTFYTNVFTIDHIYIILYTIILCFSLIIFVYILSWIKKYSRAETCGLILSASFMNNGNYGTPLALLLFGVAGFEYAIVLMVAQQMLMATVGVYYAAKGSPENDGFRCQSCCEDAYYVRCDNRISISILFRTSVYFDHGSRAFSGRRSYPCNHGNLRYAACKNIIKNHKKGKTFFCSFY
jgi:predicted permease